MKKKIAFFSTGVPDPTQGGSGIFNYLACDYLVRNDYEVSAFFRVNEDFLDKHSDLQYLRNLEEKGLKYHFVYEHKQKRLIFGWRYFLEAHQFEVCKQSIEENCLELQQVDGCLSLDAGWALALTELKVPRVCMLGDPLQHRMALGGSYSFLKPSSWKGWICKESLKNVNNRLKKELSIFNGERFAIGSFPLHQSEELQNYGIPCRHYRFFTPEPVKAKTAYRDGSLDNKIIALHVGSLYSTAGRKALNYLYKEVFPVISRLPYEFEVRFVGKCEKKHMVKSKWSNIDLKFLGHLDTLESEFLNADIFLSLLKYSVGVRTRIITALSYGIPVIADSSVAGGLPELVPERDIMYSDSPEEISVRLKTVKGNPQCMKNIGENSRKAWIKYFNPQINIPIIVDSLFEEKSFPSSEHNNQSKKTSFCVVTDFIPNPSFGGFSITTYEVVKGFLSLGLKPDICCIVSDEFKTNIKELVVNLESQGAKVHLIFPNNKPRNILDKLVPYFLVSDQVKELIQNLGPEAIFACSYDGLLSLKNIDNIPIFAFFGDPYHLVRWYSWRFNLPNKSLIRNIRSALITAVYNFTINRRLKCMIRRTARRGAIAKHHAEWFGRVDGRGCKYYRGPVADLAGGTWRDQRKKKNSVNRKYKLIHVGNTGGTANRPGIHDFVRVILPFLDKHLGRDRFEVHFLGHTFNTEPCLKEICAQRKDIILRGQVNPIKDDMQSADLMFVPNPIPLGNRTRIVTAWSLGCPVVTHSANTLGMPDMVHRKNALTASNPEEIGESIIELLHNKELQEVLAENGRATFEELFEFNIAAKKISSDFLELM